MKKNRQFSLMIILLTFSLLVIFSVSAYADEDNYKCGANLTWSISNNVLTIKGKGPMYDFDEPGFGDNFPGWRKEQRHIKRVVIKNGVTTIGNNAFYFFPNAESIDLPDTLVSIPNRAFAQWDKLKKIDIPESVKKIGGGAFPFFGNIKQVNVDPDNKAYSSKDGVLFDKKKTELIYCPCKKSGTYYIPNTVRKIREYAFYNVEIKVFHVPASVKEVGRTEKASKHTEYYEAVVYGKDEDLQKVTAVYFHGDAPKGVFLDVGDLYHKHVNMYYPAGNSTYTQAAKNRLDGKILGLGAFSSKKEAEKVFNGIWKTWKPSSKK